MKKDKKEKNGGLDLGGLVARRGKQKGLLKDTGSGSWYTARGRAAERAGRGGQEGGE